MEQTALRRSKKFWLLPLPGAALVLALNLAAHVLYVIVYSHVINPGHELADYQQHAIVSAPYVTSIVGFPSMILVCWQIAKRTPENYRYVTALSVPVIYLLIDTMILFLMDQMSSFGLLFAISYAPYFVGAFIGMRLAQGSKNDGEPVAA